MGNKLVCGCSQENRMGFGDSPYSKMMGKHIMRFWAEVFVLTQDNNSSVGTAATTADLTKWQMVVPKLVPVNLARVEDQPNLISHVTAYNTKVDKVMDVLMSYPGVELFRPSECFVYWTDPQKGLTWGLNFINPADATHFSDMVTKVDSTPDSLISNNHRRNSAKLSVKFADTPTCFPLERPKSQQNLANSRESLPTPNSLALEAKSVGNNVNSSSKSPSPNVVAGQRLSDWRVEIGLQPRDSQSHTDSDTEMLQQRHANSDCSRSLTASVHSETASSAAAQNCLNPTLHQRISNGPMTDPIVRRSDAVWEKQEVPVEQHKIVDKKVVANHIDSRILQRMLTPIGNDSYQQSSISSDEDSNVSFPPPPPPINLEKSSRKPPVMPKRLQMSSSAHADLIRSRPNRLSSTSTVSSEDHSEVKITADLGETPTDPNGPGWERQNLSEPPKPHAIVKRSSIHLLAGENGSFQSVGGSAIRTRSPSVQSDAADDSLSFASSCNSPINITSSSRNSLIKGTSAKLRKAGHLMMKRWMKPTRTGLTILTTEHWRDYWTTLKSNQLQLHEMNSNSRENIMAHSASEALPSCKNAAYQIDMTNVLVQEVPEYPRREHIFCLTTPLGEAFLFQAASEAELESWQQSIHVSAAILLAGGTNRELIGRNLRKEMEKIEEKIESVSQMIRLSQFPSVASLTEGQSCEWETDLETQHLRLFIAKCYWCSLRGSEMPNCKKVLASASRATKTYLSNLGAFTVSSMHAYIFLRPSLFQLELNSLQQQQSSDSGAKTAIYQSRTAIAQMLLPSNQVAVVSVGDNDSVTQVLTRACEKYGLDAHRYFILLRKIATIGDFLVPKDADLLQPNLVGHNIEIREKLIYHLHLDRPVADNSQVFGLTIRAMKDSSSGSLAVFVANVDDSGLARKRGVLSGDEIVGINGSLVRRMTAVAVEEVLQHSMNLCLVLRTKRVSLPVWLEPLPYQRSQESLNLLCQSERPSLTNTTEDDNESWLTNTTGTRHVRYRQFPIRRNSLPSQSRHRYSLTSITTPVASLYSTRESQSAQNSPRHVDSRNDMTVSMIDDRISSSEPIVSPSPKNQPKLGPSERLEKVLFELIETERCYTDDVDFLLKQFLQPLCERRPAPIPEISRLTQAAEAILRFQKSFLDAIQEAAGSDFLRTKNYSNPSHLRNALIHVGGVFLTNATKFKMYSPFCTSHYLMLKRLKDADVAGGLQGLVRGLNGGAKQHSCTLESYLIKPVQRVLRYPLFLQQIKSLISSGSPEYLQISDALSKMERVAEYINETQRIYEEYGANFTQLQFRQNIQGKKVDLELNQLLMFGEVDWLNHFEESGKKSRSGAPTPLLSVCFVFRTAIVLIVPESKLKTLKKGKSPVNGDPFVQRVIPLSELEVNGSDQGSTDAHYLWTLIHMNVTGRGERIYHFANRRLDCKQQFLKAIRRAGQMLAVVANNYKSTPIYSSAEVTPTRSNRNSGNSGEDQASLSSPDSGFPATSGRQKPVGPAVAELKRRPVSFYSNQSDAGYGSNTEIQSALGRRPDLNHRITSTH